jgi:hypothetical protein
MILQKILKKESWISAHNFYNMFFKVFLTSPCINLLIPCLWLPSHCLRLNTSMRTLLPSTRWILIY